MASLQPRRVRGHTYWHIVESRRVNGKPRPVPIAYLGKADDLLARLMRADALEIRSRSHGAVAAVWAMAGALDLPGTIDRHLQEVGRRRRLGMGKHQAQPVRNDGLSVGQSLTLAAVGRACHATSKRGFAEWAATTTLGEMAGVKDVGRLTSQHFWDQMDQVPIDSIAPMEREIVGRVLEQFALPVDTLLFDATNFFTFIASTNKRATLPARGHNKQKRDDLRQVGVALLCTRHGGIPLWHQTYGGQVADSKSFADVLPAFRQRLVELGRQIESLTLVYDKGNVSRGNQERVDASKLHYVTGVTAASQAELVRQANPQLADVVLDNGETVQAFRTTRKIWGIERTAVVLLSERLRQGQMRGILQHVASTERWLSSLQETLQRGTQRRDRARIQRDIETRLHGRQRLNDVLHVELSGEDPHLRLAYHFDQQAFETLANESLGRIVLITDQAGWSTAEIIDVYHGQSGIEAIFAHLKDPMRGAPSPVPLDRPETPRARLHVHPRLPSVPRGVPARRTGPCTVREHGETPRRPRRGPTRRRRPPEPDREGAREGHHPT